jgi:hypothetical protein
VRHPVEVNTKGKLLPNQDRLQPPTIVAKPTASKPAQKIDMSFPKQAPLMQRNAERPSGGRTSESDDDSARKMIEERVRSKHHYKGLDSNEKRQKRMTMGEQALQQAMSGGLDSR